MKWLTASLGDIISLEYGAALKEENRDFSGSIPVAGSNGIVGYHSQALVKGPGIVVGRKGTAGKVTWFDTDFWPIDTTFYVKLKIPAHIRWIFYLLQYLKLEQLSIITGVPGINRNNAYSLQVFLVPPSEQRCIAEILDRANELRKKRAEADLKAKRILPALFIKIFGNPSDWTSLNNTKTLGSLVNIQSGSTPSKQNSDYWNGEITWVSAKDMKRDIIFDSIDRISHLAIEETNIKYVEPGAILIVVRGMILAHTIPIALAGSRLTINQDMKALQLNCSDINSDYLHAALKASSSQILSQVGTAAHGTRKIDTDELLKLPILIPSKENLEKFSRQVKECRLILTRVSETKEKLEKLFYTLLQRAFSGELTAKWREAHMKELLAEMEEQTKALNLPVTDFKELPLFRSCNKQMIEGDSYE